MRTDARTHPLTPLLFAGCTSQGKGIILTSDIGNVRHSFKCRDRTSLLAAFAELQVRKWQNVTVPLASIAQQRLETAALRLAFEARLVAALAETTPQELQIVQINPTVDFDPTSLYFAVSWEERPL